MNTYEFCADWVCKQGAGMRVLDYGCGVGHIVRLLRARGVEAYGCEKFYEGGDRSDQIEADVAQYISRLPGDRIQHDDASFDIVLSNQVLEHVPDLDHVVAEMSRVLRPGGLALNVFPDAGVWREGHCGIPFLHWFPKGSGPRVYYAALLRSLGIGLHRTGKPAMEWSRNFCAWLDAWTYYRPVVEVRATFGRYFSSTEHREELWFDARFDARFSHVPVPIRRLFVRKFGGITLVSRKQEQA